MECTRGRPTESYDEETDGEWGNWRNSPLFFRFFDTFSDDLEDLEFNPWLNHSREKIIWNPEDVKVNVKDPLELIQEKNYIKI